MAIKVDLEKAYDRLSWNFIRDTLIDARFPSDLIRLIMQCIETPTLSVLWNGSASEKFTPCRGIRQGDPLSPYIFVLCLERLSQIINKNVEDGRWEMEAVHSEKEWSEDVSFMLCR